MPDAAYEIAWREDDSAVFIDYGRAFTPDRERQHEIVCDLVASVTPCHEVVELCCGNGDLAKLVLTRLPDVRVRAFDGSPRMLSTTRRTCVASVDRLDLRSFDLAATAWRALQPPPDAIFSSLAVHHLDGGQKRQLFRDLFAALRPGGLLVLADLIRPSSQAGWQVAAEDWDRAVAARSRALYGDDLARRKFEELRWNYFRWPNDNAIDHPSSIAEHITWFGDAGFENVDLHWMQAGHAILSGRKPCCPEQFLQVRIRR
jgi:tRNA (cmo5U34)-methyltransferase